MADRRFDAVVLGGGAAGLFCAGQAARRGLSVALIEHNAELGRKIVISGGGRCNFTNIHTVAENFVSRNPHFAKSALAGYTPQDFVELVRRHKIGFYEKKLGQLFCRDSSRAIVEMLLEECRRGRVDTATSCTVLSVTRDQGFRIETSRGIYVTPKLVVATGGLSFPKIGATSFGYDLARQFGLMIEETRPSLVAMVLAGGGRPDLAGVSADALASAGGKQFRENILFTHRGLSGPAILQVSNYWKAGEPVTLDLCPQGDITEVLAEGRRSGKTVANALSRILPARIADMIAATVKRSRVADLSIEDIQALSRSVHEWSVFFSRTEGYDRAEVTLGGVSTQELSSKTMECVKVPGLYFIGEVVDVTGWLGGYNFQWAWSSAFAAARSL